MSSPDVVANLEFEMIGHQDPKMPEEVLLLTGWNRSDPGPTLRAHGALLGPNPYPEEHFERSENYSLALKGVVAHTAARWGTPPTYRQPSDDLAHLDLSFLTGGYSVAGGACALVGVQRLCSQVEPGDRPVKR